VRLLAAAFAAGVITDVLISQFYLAIGERRILLAVILSILVTAIPFYITERGITTRRRSIFLAYALGCGAGTAIGLLIKL